MISNSLSVSFKERWLLAVSQFVVPVFFIYQVVRYLLQRHRGFVALINLDDCFFNSILLFLYNFLNILGLNLGFILGLIVNIFVILEVIRLFAVRIANQRLFLIFIGSIQGLLLLLHRCARLFWAHFQKWLDPVGAKFL